GMPAYTGPVVPVPTWPEDAIDEHGVPLAGRPQPSSPGEPGISRRRIEELDGWDKEQTPQRDKESRLDTPSLDDWRRAIIREEVAFPERVEIEFARVMGVVFAGV